VCPSHERLRAPPRGAATPVRPPPAEDDWQASIAAYLTRYWRMGPVGVYEMLSKCEFDEALRARYLRMASGAT
jgi:hypothetical protein